MRKDQREMILDRIRAYEFAAAELNLYLDSHPGDKGQLTILILLSNRLKR